MVLMKNSLGFSLAILVGVVLFPNSIVTACSRGYPFRLGELFSADLIVRATAVRYIASPDPNNTTTGVPESTVEFKIEETLWGIRVPEMIVLNGYLTDTDDFNDVPLPYRFVRPNGRSGSCFANSYKRGSQFLLFLKRGGSVYTTNISALGPTNEQLRGPDDQWIKWVKAYLSPCARQDVDGIDYSDRSKPELEDLIAKRQSDLEKYRLARCYLVKYGAGGKGAARYLEVVNFYETIPERK
jgi:hypothetical protein